MATQKSFFGRTPDKQKGNPLLQPAPAPAAPAVPGPKPPPKPTAPKPTAANPFLGRIWNVNQMDPGPQRQRAARDLRGDRRTWNQAQQRQRNADYADAVWTNNNAYNPFLTPPNAPYANPGFDPAHGYGKPLNSFLQTGIGRAWIEQNPEAYYGTVMSQQGHGYGDNTAYGRYVRDRFDDEYRGLAMARSQSPGLTWTQYLLGRLPQMEQEYRARPFMQRGEIPLAGASATWIGGF